MGRAHPVTVFYCVFCYMYTFTSLPCWKKNWCILDGIGWCIAWWYFLLYIKSVWNIWLATYSDTLWLHGRAQFVMDCTIQFHLFLYCIFFLPWWQVRLCLPSFSWPHVSGWQQYETKIIKFGSLQKTCCHIIPHSFLPCLFP